MANELCAHLIDVTVRLLGTGEGDAVFRHDASLADRLKDNTAAVFSTPKQWHVSWGHDAARVRRTGCSGAGRTERPRCVPSATRRHHRLGAGRWTVSKGRPAALFEYKRYVDDLAELAAAVRGNKKLSVTLDEEMLVQETVLRASGMA